MKHVTYESRADFKNFKERERKRGGDKRFAFRQSRLADVGAFSYIIEKPLTVPGRCSAGAVECAANEDEEPHHHRARNDRVDVQASLRRGGTSPPLSSLLPFLPFPPALDFDAPRRRVPQNATRRARNRCGSSHVHQLEESTSELGERAAATKHESIG